MSIEQPWKVALALGTTVVAWAGAFIAIRDAGHAFDPGPLAFGRMLFACAALTVMAVLGGIDWPPRRSLLPVALYGLGWFAAYVLALNEAERHIDAGTAAMLVNLAPLLVGVASGLFFGEGFPRPLVAGMVVAFAGVVLIGLASSTGHVDGMGVALGVLSAVLYAASALLQKQRLGGLNVITYTWPAALAALVVLIPFAPAYVATVASAPLGANLGVAYLGIIATALAYSTWGYALKRLSAGLATGTTYLVPALTIVLSWALLGEVPAALTLAGGVLCLLGVAITRLRRPGTR